MSETRFDLVDQRRKYAAAREAHAELLASAERLLKAAEALGAYKHTSPEARSVAANAGAVFGILLSQYAPAAPDVWTTPEQALDTEIAGLRVRADRLRREWNDLMEMAQKSRGDRRKIQEQRAEATRSEWLATESEIDVLKAMREAA